MSADIRLGVARGIQYGLITEPDPFAARAERLGAGLLRVFFYWSQLEPEPGRFDWTAVDAVLDQVDDDTELWFMIGASSPWATTRATDFLPASPPGDQRLYARVLRQLVERCEGRITWWQCENEPCNPLFWVGSSAEYVEQLQVFAEAVRSADPDARVVLGGCPPGVYPRSDAGSSEQAFFDNVLDAGRDAFDDFDIHLYGDPYGIPATIADIREAMRPHGNVKPILAGEYNGPLPVEYPEVLGALADVLNSGATDAWYRLTSQQFLAGELSTPLARAAMKHLYREMAALPPHLQMFMAGCTEELEDLRHRLNARDLIIRNVLALSCGVRRTVCWQIRPDVSTPPDPYEFLRLMFSKSQLLPYEDRSGARFPCADAFAEVAARVSDVDNVQRVHVAEDPDVYLFELVRGDQVCSRVSWQRHDERDEPQWTPL